MWPISRCWPRERLSSCARALPRAKEPTLPSVKLPNPVVTGNCQGLFILARCNRAAQLRKIARPITRTVLVHQVDVGTGRDLLCKELQDSIGSGNAVWKHEM